MQVGHAMPSQYLSTWGYVTTCHGIDGNGIDRLHMVTCKQLETLHMPPIVQP